MSIPRPVPQRIRPSFAAWHQGEPPDGLEPPDFAAMAEALERNGVNVIGPPVHNK